MPRSRLTPTEEEHQKLGELQRDFYNAYQRIKKELTPKVNNKHLSRKKLERIGELLDIMRVALINEWQSNFTYNVLGTSRPPYYLEEQGQVCLRSNDIPTEVSQDQVQSQSPSPTPTDDPTILT